MCRYYLWYWQCATRLSSCFYGKQTTKTVFFSSDHIKVRPDLNVYLSIYIHIFGDVGQPDPYIFQNDIMGISNTVKLWLWAISQKWQLQPSCTYTLGLVNAGEGIQTRMLLCIPSASPETEKQCANDGESWITPSPTPQVPSISWTVECMASSRAGGEQAQGPGATETRKTNSRLRQTPNPEKGDQGHCWSCRARTHCHWHLLRTVSILFSCINTKWNSTWLQREGEFTGSRNWKGQGWFPTQLGEGDPGDVIRFTPSIFCFWFPLCGSTYKQMPLFCW